MPNFDAIIFDLDDTLLDTSGQLVPLAIEESCQALIDRGLNIELEKCLDEKMNFSKANQRQNFFNYLVEKYGVTESKTAVNKEELIKLGKKTFYNRKIRSPLEPFPGVRPFLQAHCDHYLLFLVTEGHVGTQIKKLEALDIEHFFTKSVFVNPDKEETKKLAFGQIVKEFNLDPQRVLCVGNRLDNEIQAGNSCHMKTCLLRAGEYKDLSPQNQQEVPDYEIFEFAQLPHRCEL